MSTAGHGPNIGHGFVKYILIDEHGNEREPVVFPAMIAGASKAVAGAIAAATTVEFGGKHWWVGDDALLSKTPITMLAQERLNHPVFIPTLMRAALQTMGNLNGAVNGVCVTGLPATWATNADKGRQLGERMRAATPIYGTIRVIPEPLGLVYSVLLDNYGEVAGDTALKDGRVAVVDIGHHTVDVIEIQKLVPVPSGLNTYQLGTARPLQEIRGRLTQDFEREFSLYEIDQAVRAERLRVSGQLLPLPTGWDRPLRENGELIATRLVEAWGRGTQFDAILIGGGGGELEPLVHAIQERFTHAQVVDRPQTAVARGYARLARRYAKKQTQSGA
jgi:hypothetical protein